MDEELRKHLGSIVRIILVFVSGYMALSKTPVVRYAGEFLQTQVAEVAMAVAGLVIPIAVTIWSWYRNKNEVKLTDTALMMPEGSTREELKAVVDGRITDVDVVSEGEVVVTKEPENKETNQ
jgi:hypothetical protein